MGKINVLILSRTDPYPGFLEDIGAVSSRVSVGKESKKMPVGITYPVKEDKG
jgi:hypothetical protein